MLHVTSNMKHVVRYMLLTYKQKYVTDREHSHLADSNLPVFFPRGDTTLKGGGEGMKQGKTMHMVLRAQCIALRSFHHRSAS